MNSNFICICVTESQIILFNYLILFVISFVNFNLEYFDGLQTYWTELWLSIFKLLKNCLNICLFIMKHLVLFHILNKHRICVRWFSHCYMHFLNGNPTWMIKSLKSFDVIKHKKGLIFLLPSIYWFFSPRFHLGKTNSRE